MLSSLNLRGSRTAADRRDAKKKRNSREYASQTADNKPFLNFFCLGNNITQNNGRKMNFDANLSTNLCTTYKLRKTNVRLSKTLLLEWRTSLDRRHILWGTSCPIVFQPTHYRLNKQPQKRRWRHSGAAKTIQCAKQWLEILNIK